jgi:hypothetical protein
MCVRRISWFSGPHSVLDSADKPGWELVRIPLPTPQTHIEEFVVDAFAIWIKSASFVFFQKSKVRNQESDPKNCQKKRAPWSLLPIGVAPEKRTLKVNLLRIVTGLNGKWE